MANYNAEYSPSIIRMRAAETLDWPNEKNLPDLVWGK
jgi:hypothetical protein